MAYFYDTCICLMYTYLFCYFVATDVNICENRTTLKIGFSNYIPSS